MRTFDVKQKDAGDGDSFAVSGEVPGSADRTALAGLFLE
jgi:hypothetical protein